MSAAFFALTEVTSEGDHAAYNAWHQLDHMPEQYTLDCVVHGERWVRAPRCREESTSSPGDGWVERVHYLTLYLMTGTPDRAVADFYGLAAALHRADRFYPHRRALFGGPVAPVEALVSEAVPVSAAALPFRPNRGVFVVLETRSGALEPSDWPSDWQRDGSLATLVDLPGIAGAWSFATTTPVGCPQEGDVAGSRFSYRTADPTGESARLTVLYLQGDPVASAATVRQHVEAGRHPAGRLVLAGPFESIRPWEWTWFDRQ